MIAPPVPASGVARAALPLAPPTVVVRARPTFSAGATAGETPSVPASVDCVVEPRATIATTGGAP